MKQEEGKKKKVGEVKTVERDDWWCDVSGSGAHVVLEREMKGHLWSGEMIGALWSEKGKKKKD